jgi:hypothetical protein
VPNRAQPGRLAWIALLVAGCAALPAPPPVASGPSGVPSAPSAPPSLALPTDDVLPTELPPTIAPPPVGDPSGRVWQQIDLRASAPNVLTDVLATDEGLVASGVAGEAGQIPVILRSADGLTWTPEPISSAIGGSPSSLGAVGGRVLAVGGAETGRCAHPFAIDFWARDRSGSWTEAPWDDKFCSGIADVSFLDDGGTAILAGVGDGDLQLVWSSTDGLVWRDLRPALGDFLPMTAAIVGDQVLLVGESGGGSLVLRSGRGGRGFVDVAAPRVVAGAEPFQAIVRGRDVLLFLVDGPALGLARRGAGGAWSVEPAEGIRGDAVTRIQDLDGVLLAVGSDDEGRPVAWSSRDGLAWTDLATPSVAGAAITGAARIGSSIVLVGSVPSADGTRTTGVIWTAPASILEG